MISSSLGRKNSSQAWCHTHVTPELRRLRQKDQAFEASLSSTGKSCLRKKTKKVNLRTG
jgi:hypothetical protein